MGKEENLMTYHKQKPLWNTILSIMLILLGFLLLLDTFNIVGDMTEVFLSGMFGLGALVSIGYYLQNRQHWWALIPGGILVGLSGFFAIDAMPFLNRRIDEVSFMMFAFALAFWVIFVTQTRQKWAIIPAGIFTFVATIITTNEPEFVMAGVFCLVALFGFRYFLKNRIHWWVLIPSSVMLGVSGVLAIESLSFLRQFEAGSIMLFALALGFWLIYIGQAKHWWAGIPAGILTTIAFMVTLESIIQGIDYHGPFILIGFGLTFFMLWLRRTHDGTHWAIWPAGILVGIGLMISAVEQLNILWPLIFIVTGLWLIRRNFISTDHNRSSNSSNEDLSTPID